VICVNYSCEIRTKLGVVGLDALLPQGIPRGTQILLIGPPGSGKTLLSLEFAYRSARMGVASTYISLEEPVAQLLCTIGNVYSELDDFDELMKRGTIKLADTELETQAASKEAFDVFLSGINETALSNKSQMVILGSVSHLRPICSDDREFMRLVTSMTKNFRKLGITAVMTLEISNSEAGNIDGLMGTAMFDGIITMRSGMSRDAPQYMINITKMRNVDHSKATRPYEITSHGFNVFQ